MSTKDDAAALTVFGANGAEAASRDGVMAALTSEQLAALPMGPLTLGAWVSAVIMLGGVCYALHRVHTFYHAVAEKRKQATME